MPDRVEVGLVPRTADLLRRVVHSKRYVATVVLLAVATRIVYMLLVPSQPVSDFWWYYKTATTLAEGGGYSWNGMTTAWYPVGYPLFLSLIFSVTGPSVVVGKLANLTLVLIGLLLTWRLGVVLFRSEAVGRIGMTLYGLLPDGIFWSAQLASEPLFVALALGGVLLLLSEEHRWWNVAVAGVLFGLAVLVRPVGVVLPFVILLAGSARDGRLRTWGHRLTEFGLLCLMVATVLAPWTLRNYVHFGGFAPLSTSGGFNLVIGNNPVANGVFQRDYATFQMVPEPYRTPCATSFDKYLWNPDGPALLGTTHTTLNELNIDRACRAAAVRYIVENPLSAARLFFKKIWLLYRGDSGGAFWTLDHLAADNAAIAAAQSWVRRVAQLTWLVLFGAFLGTLIVLPRAARKTGGEPPVFPWFGVVFIALFTAFTCVFYASGRYYAPMVPWICLYVAALIVWLFDLDRAPAVRPSTSD